MLYQKILLLFVALILTTNATATEQLSEVELLAAKLNETSYPIFDDLDDWSEWKALVFAYLDGDNSPDVTVKPRFYNAVTLLEIAAKLAGCLNDWSLLEKMKERAANFNFMSNDIESRESIFIKSPLDTGKYHQEIIPLTIFLLNSGADPTLNGASEMSPIHFFARFEIYRPVILELSLDKLRRDGVDTNIRRPNGFTPLLEIAHDSGKLYNWESVLAKLVILAEYGADLSAEDNKGRNVFDLIRASENPYPRLQDVREEMVQWIENKIAGP